MDKENLAWFNDYNIIIGWVKLKLEENIVKNKEYDRKKLNIHKNKNNKGGRSINSPCF